MTLAWLLLAATSALSLAVKVSSFTRSIVVADPWRAPLPRLRAEEVFFSHRRPAPAAATCIRSRSAGESDTARRTGRRVTLALRFGAESAMLSKEKPPF